MYVGETSFAGSRRALVQFDVSAIPSTAEINGVTLNFNVSKGHGFQTITLHRLLSNWGEGLRRAGANLEGGFEPEPLSRRLARG